MEHDLSTGYPPFGEFTLTIQQLVTAFVSYLEQSEFLFCMIHGGIKIPQNALWLEFSSIHMAGVKGLHYHTTEKQSTVFWASKPSLLFIAMSKLSSGGKG